MTLITQEGAAAVEEAIKFLESMKPLPAIEAVSPGLCSAAMDHAADLSTTGNTGHDGSDGSSPFDRMNRHGEWQGSAAENIAFGEGDVRSKVIQLIIDDGVPSRGHRTNIFGDSFTRLGVAEMTHPKFKAAHVQTFAGGYKEKDGAVAQPAVTAEKDKAVVVEPATAAKPTAAKGPPPATQAKSATAVAAPAATGPGAAVPDVSTPRASDKPAGSAATAPAAPPPAAAVAKAPAPAAKPPVDGLASAPKPPPGGRTDVKTTIQTVKEGNKTTKTTTKTTIVTAADGSTSTTVETFVETTISS